jgi:hypothetical protein
VTIRAAAIVETALVADELGVEMATVTVSVSSVVVA